MTVAKGRPLALVFDGHDGRRIVCLITAARQTWVFNIVHHGDFVPLPYLGEMERIKLGAKPPFEMLSVFIVGGSNNW